MFERVAKLVKTDRVRSWRLNELARSIFLTEFVSAFFLAMRYFFKPKATINYPFERGPISPREKGNLAWVAWVGTPDPRMLRAVTKNQTEGAYLTYGHRVCWRAQTTLTTCVAATFGVRAPSSHIRRLCSCSSRSPASGLLKIQFMISSGFQPARCQGLNTDIACKDSGSRRGARASRTHDADL